MKFLDQIKNKYENDMKKVMNGMGVKQVCIISFQHVQ